MDTPNIVQVELWTIARTDKGTAILLRTMDNERVIPIYVGQLELQSILIGISKIKLPRPLTHDIFLQSLDLLGSRVLRIEITKFATTIFYTNIVLERGEEELNVDARPSDALALALRIACPIFVREEIIEKLGMLPERIHVAVPNAAEPTIQELKHRLEQELAQENYESAARIRDRIHALEKTSAHVPEDALLSIEEQMYEVYSNKEEKQ